MKAPIFALGLLIAVGHHGIALSAKEPPAIYANDFGKETIGEEPADVLVLSGDFRVKDQNGNRLLELPGTPLESHGLLFGPTEQAGIAVSARIHGTKKGRRYPVFGIGVNGVTGYRLFISPAKRAIELHKGPDPFVQESVPYQWESDKWTHFLLQVRELKKGEWKIQGKVWQEGQEEPEGWTIEAVETDRLFAGQPSIWGSPYSGTPIRFDDLAVRPAQQTD